MKLESANKIFIDNHYNLRPEFAEKAKTYFESQPALYDFVTDYDNSRQKINEWVEAKTNNKIQELLPQGSVNANTKMILVNAIYFKGDWLYQFDKQNTNQSGEFILQSGDVIQVPMMKIEASLQSGSISGIN